MTNQEIVKKVVEIILKHAKPERIYLYGSHANGEATESSDIDIAYEDKDFMDYGLIEEEIEELRTLVKVEVKNIAQTDERFRNRVRSTGRVLYSANKKLRAEDGLYNFTKAYERFKEALGFEDYLAEQGFADIYPDLMMKRFEFTFEMSWKAIKRYLSFVGIECKNPRACFQEASTQGLIEDASVWLDMIDTRNAGSHVYSQEEIKWLLGRMGDYGNAFERLRDNLERELLK